jgi:hypothetical protein
MFVACNPLLCFIPLYGTTFIMERVAPCPNYANKPDANKRRVVRPPLLPPRPPPPTLSENVGRIHEQVKLEKKAEQRTFERLESFPRRTNPPFKDRCLKPKEWMRSAIVKLQQDPGWNRTFRKAMSRDIIICEFASRLNDKADLNFM